MSYLVFARKYRPQTFREVVQQHHVTQTLINAIDSNRVAHAIIFSGPRGTGKTTVARILAKAMNCEKGPTSNPCGTCQSCRDITSGNAADVFEIDGASNNSVDQVRELRDNCRYMPQIGSNKIYIIDEVHMLSTSAFNALLKILEEPPSHVMFIFATTEPQKIPITILSRCQRYDLRRFDFSAISDHIRHILNEEGIKIPEESIALIAREAGGCLRDALSLLDQVVACSDGRITHEKVIDILGVIDRSLIFSLGEAFLKGDVRKLFEIIDQTYQRGQDVKRLYWELIEHLRHLLICKMGRKVSELIDLPQYELDLIKTQSEVIGETALFQLIDMMFAEEASIKWALNPKLAIEVVFLRLMYVKPALSIDQLIKGLDDLKNHTGTLSMEVSPSIKPRISAPLKREREAEIPQKEKEENEVSPDKKVPQDTALAPPPAVSEKQSETDLKDDHPLKSHPDIDFSLQPDIFLSKLIERFSRIRPSLAANLEKCQLRPESQSAFTLVVSGNDFVVKSVSKSISFIEKACKEWLNKAVQVKVTLNTEELKKKKEKAKRKLSAKHQALDHPLIASAIEIFNGKIIDIKSHKEG